MSPKTLKAIAELVSDPPQQHDEHAMRLIRESAKTLYGWDWPESLGLYEGAKALFDFLIVKANEECYCGGNGRGHRPHRPGTYEALG